MASGDFLMAWTPLANEPPSSNYATAGLRNGNPTLDFDDTTAEGAIFSGVLPASVGVTAYVHWVAAATSGTGGWTVEIERQADGGTDIDSDSFDTVNTVTAATVPGTSGVVKVTNVALANLDSTVSGNAFRLRVKRDVANDTATGDLQLLKIELRET